MEIGTALGLGYAVVALLATIPTCREQRANGIRGFIARGAGLLACLLWPLALAAVVMAIGHAGRGERARPERHDGTSRLRLGSEGSLG